VITGYSSGVIDFGGGPLASGATYITKLSQAGAFAWSKAVTGTAQIESLAADGTDILVSGSASGTLHVGAANVSQSTGGAELVALKLDPSGALVSSLRAGNGAGVSGNQIAVNASHVAAIVATSRPGSMSMGTGSLSCVGGACVMAARLTM
jgi:hypothetical protein